MYNVYDINKSTAIFCVQEIFDTEAVVLSVLVSFFCVVLLCTGCFGIEKLVLAQGENGFLMREKTLRFLGQQ